MSHIFPTIGKPVLGGQDGKFLKVDSGGNLDQGDVPNPDLSTYVQGPASATDNHVPFFNGTTGTLIKDSGLTLSGSNTGDQDLSNYLTKSGDGSHLCGVVHSESDPIFAAWNKCSGISIRHTQISNWASATSAFVTGTPWVGFGYLTDAPSDGNIYGRKNGAWADVPITGGSDSVEIDPCNPHSLHLVGDRAWTCSNQYYGTNYLGCLGWWDLPNVSGCGCLPYYDPIWNRFQVTLDGYCCCPDIKGSFYGGHIQNRTRVSPFCDAYCIQYNDEIIEITNEWCSHMHTYLYTPCSMSFRGGADILVKKIDQCYCCGSIAVHGNFEDGSDVKVISSSYGWIRLYNDTDSYVWRIVGSCL